MRKEAMTILELINVIYEFEKLINKRGWSLQMGIHKNSASLIKKRFYEGGVTIKTMQNYISKAKQIEHK